MAVFGSRVLTAGFALLTAGSLNAAAQATCDVGDAAKGNIARATLMVNQARDASTTPLAMTNIKAAVKLLETPEKNDDAVVRAYVLGSALSLAGNQAGVGLQPTRGQLGFSTNPGATMDLVGTIDSLFKVVETAKPACVEYTTYYRGGQKFYLDIVNGAINSFNADKLDSASYYAALANRLYSHSPYGYMVLGNVAAKQSNNAKALEYWKEALVVSEKDTNFRDVNRNMLASIGAQYINAANTASGAEKIVQARLAADAYGKLVAIPGTRGYYLNVGRQQYQAALLAAGDTAAFIKSYAGLLASPADYDYQDLLNSAVNVARANRAADAARLFAGALAQNAYSRDALYNLALSYLANDEMGNVMPIVTRLVAIDPGNPENFNFGARAYLAMAKAAKEAKRPTTVVAAYNDSTLQWFNRGNKLQVEVTFSEFSPNEQQATLAGIILDRRDKADAITAASVPRGKTAPKKTYVPKTATLVFEALDKNGAVVGTSTVTTEALTPGKTARFTTTITGAGIIAYRYTVGS